MKKLLLIGVAILAIAGGAQSLALGQAPAPAPAAPEAAAPPPAPPCSPARKIYALGRWNEKHSRAPARGERICPSSRHVRRLRTAYFEYRAYRMIATYPGPGSGPRSPHDGRWWSVPYYPIVCGESGGDWWPEPNPADRAYQIIPSTWRAYTPSRGEEHQLERRYRIRLSFGSSAAEGGYLENHIVADRGWRDGTAWYGRC